MVHMRKRTKFNAKVLQDYPFLNPMVYAGRDYIVCSRLEIGYFVLASGRLVFLPTELRETAYYIYETE